MLFFAALALWFGSFVTFAMFVRAIGPYRRVRSLHQARLTPICAAVEGGSVLLHGTIIAARRPAPHPRLTTVEAVCSRFEVLERRGKRRNVALQTTLGQLFTLEDRGDARVDVDPDGVTLYEGLFRFARLESCAPALRRWVEARATFRWKPGRARCTEHALVAGQRVAVRGDVVRAGPQSRQRGDTRLRLIAREVSMLADSPWRTLAGIQLLLGAAGCLLCSALAVLVC